MRSNDFMEKHHKKDDMLIEQPNIFDGRELIKLQVVWKKKRFRIAGTAYLGENRIEMSLNYLIAPDAMKFIKNTMLHELAYLINRSYGECNHDDQ